MPDAPRHPHRARAAALVLAAIVSVQFGGALAAQLIPVVGVLGSVALRITIAAVLLLLIARPRLRRRPAADWAAILALGATLALMNATFYAALARLPLGLAVTLEFLGPLGLAAATSRRWRDLTAVAAALAGVVLVSRFATAGAPRPDPTGIALALTAGACWAAYILANRAVGRRTANLDGIALAMGVAAALTLPAGVLVAGRALLEPGTLARGAGIAALSSALPYSLELLALRTLPAGAFGILMALEPVVAALAGAFVLHQFLGWDQLLGMVLVVAAAIVVVRTDTAPT